MDITIDSLLEGASRATGAVAIIDVFRAFTTGAVAFANGADRIIMVGSVAEALALRANGVGQICIGEVGGQAPAEFDFGNSPFEVLNVDFTGKTIIQRTSSGTQGIVAAKQAQALFASALVTAPSTARALRASGAEHISLVAMGESAATRTDEDELCALHLRNLLEGRTGDPDSVRRIILAGGDVLRFNDPTRPHLNAADLDIALDIGRYDFAIRVTIEDSRPVARMQKSAPGS